ncbi:hypothetical protein BH23ACT2_BH23ACT2_02130 [soil metagenome]
MTSAAPRSPGCERATPPIPSDGTDLGDAFQCACCGGTDSEPAGRYELPTRRADDGRVVGMAYPLRSCTTCHHVQACPRPSDDELTRYYEEDFWTDRGVSAGAITGDWHHLLTETSALWERFERADKQVSHLVASAGLTPSARVADLGSGLSPVLYHFRQRGFTDLHALEPFEGICDYLQGQGITTYATLLEDFIERDDLPEFDAMVISHTVEHLADPELVLCGLRRHLAPGGVLYVDVPHRDDLLPSHEGLHLHFFAPDPLSRLMVNSGFEVDAVEVDHLSALDRALLKVLYAVYGRFLGNRGGLGTRPAIERLHRWVWRPTSRLLRLNVKIFVSVQDLRLVGRTTRPASAAVSPE